MKSRIPQELRGKTLSNIIVICTGIAVAVTLLHLGQVWQAVQKVLDIDSMKAMLNNRTWFLAFPRWVRQGLLQNLNGRKQSHFLHFMLK